MLLQEAAGGVGFVRLEKGKSLSTNRPPHASMRQVFIRVLFYNEQATEEKKSET